MEDNSRNSGDSSFDSSFEVVNMKDALTDEGISEEVPTCGDRGWSACPICKHCQKKYKHKDTIAWIEIECKGFCLNCRKEMLSRLGRIMTVCCSFLEFKAYRKKGKSESVSSNIEKLPPAEGHAKQNRVCRHCKVEYEKGNDAITWFKVDCDEGLCCLDCGKAKCFILGKVLKDSAPTLEHKIYEEDVMKVSGSATKLQVCTLKEKFASLLSSVEKPQPEEGTSKQTICSCCNFIFTCTNCKERDVPCQGNCSCCTHNKSKNTERIVQEIAEAMEEDDGPSATGGLPSMK